MDAAGSKDPSIGSRAQRWLPRLACTAWRQLRAAPGIVDSVFAVQARCGARLCPAV